jgi:serine/threonine protein kinase
MGYPIRSDSIIGRTSPYQDENEIKYYQPFLQSLVHILKNRKTLTEPEVRFYVKHLLEGCRYIHSQRIIHRDLKLGNMLLNDKMELKIADFGLATRVNFVGDKKM